MFVARQSFINPRLADGHLFGRRVKPVENKSQLVPAVSGIKSSEPNNLSNDPLGFREIFDAVLFLR